MRTIRSEPAALRLSRRSSTASKTNLHKRQGITTLVALEIKFCALRLDSAMIFEHLAVCRGTFQRPTVPYMVQYC